MKEDHCPIEATRLNVMLVDDEPLALSGYELLIDWAAAGFDVVARCESADQALREISTACPSLIVTDLYMPGLDGVAPMQAARELGYQGAFVIVSAHEDFQKAQEAIRYGVAGYLLKPLDEEEAMRTLLVVQSQFCSKGAQSSHMQEPQPADPNDPPDMLQQMRRYIEQRYAENISLGTMADALGHNAAYLGRVFQRLTGVNFRGYLNSHRLDVAAERILATRDPIYLIAEAVGYGKYAYFLEKFKLRFGMMPDAYRKANP